MLLIVHVHGDGQVVNIFLLFIPPGELHVPSPQNKWLGQSSVEELQVCLLRLV